MMNNNFGYLLLIAVGVTMVGVILVFIGIHEIYVNNNVFWLL